MSKTNSKSTKSIKSSTVKKTTMRSLVTTLLRKNPKMSYGEIYLNILRSGGVKTNNINLTTFFSRSDSYPSIRSVYEVARSIKADSTRKVAGAKISRKTSR